MGRCLRENPQVWNCGSIAGPDTSQIAAEATGSVMKARLPERSNVARPRSPVPVQREMERERSPLVSNTRPYPPFERGIFKASGSTDPMCFGMSAKDELPRP